MGVDNIRNQMDSQNGEGTRGDNTGRVAVFEAEGWGRHHEGSSGRGGNYGGMSHLYRTSTGLDHYERDIKPG